MSGSAQRLKAAHMGADKSLGVASDALDLLARPFQMRARAIDARLIHHVGDVQISRSWPGGQGCRLDHHVTAHLVDTDICVMFSPAWLKDIRSTASTNCCRGPGKLQILSIPDFSARPGRLRLQFSFFRPKLRTGRKAPQKDTAHVMPRPTI
jgi:hypothetical protein